MDSDSFQMKFPYWECLYGLWQTLPNFNPQPLSSDPGQGIGGQMESLMNGGNIDLGGSGEAEPHMPHEPQSPYTGTPEIFGDKIEVCDQILIVLT